jgi:hypothetical protein
MYKRFYFIDWIVLNRYKRDILNEVDLFIDAQTRIPLYDDWGAPEALSVGFRAYFTSGEDKKE